MRKLYTLGGGILVSLLIFIVGGFAVTLLKDRYDQGVIERHEREQKVHTFDSLDTDLGKKSDSLGAQLREVKVPYIVYRDRVIHDNPADTALRNLAGRCDQLILTCEARHSIDSARIANLKSEVDTLKRMTKSKPPRISAFALGGYDWYNQQQIVQLGGDVRIAGPLSVTGYLEAARGAEPERVRTRGVVAAKFTFR